MPTAGDGYEQSYNVQAGVEVKTHIVLEQHVTQQPNDKQEIEPALAQLAHLPEALGQADVFLADTGFLFVANV